MSGSVIFCLLMPWGRVGSNLVSALLQDRPGLVLQNEPTTRIRTLGERNRVPRHEQAAQQLKELERLLMVSGRYQWTGLKLSHRSLLQPSDYLGRLLAAGSRLVLMTRGNHLRCAVSQMRALERARSGKSGLRSPWGVRASEQKPGPSEIDPNEAVRLTRLFGRLEAATLASVRQVFGTDWLAVEYADLAADPGIVLADICDWIGMPRFEVTALPYRKATADDLADDVLNHAALVEVVTDAGLERFLGPERLSSGVP